MFMISAIRVAVVASLLMSTTFVGGQRCRNDAALETCHRAARQTHSCGCQAADRECCCGNACDCARVPEDRGTNNGVPARSIERVEPWSLAAPATAFVAVTFAGPATELFAADAAVRNLSLVCMGTRLNC